MIYLFIIIIYIRSYQNLSVNLPVYFVKRVRVKFTHSICVELYELHREFSEHLIYGSLCVQQRPLHLKHMITQHTQRCDLSIFYCY